MSSAGGVLPRYEALSQGKCPLHPAQPIDIVGHGIE